MEIINMTHEELCAKVLELEAQLAELKVTKGSPKRAAKAPKTERLEDPSQATSLEELSKATVETLRVYLKSNDLMTSGKKDDLVARAWKSINGDITEADKSPKARIKAAIPTKEKHQCAALNGKGNPCNIAAGHQHEDKWYCYKHIDSVKSESDDSASSEITEEPAPKPKVKKVKKVKKPAPPMEEEPIEENSMEDEN